MDLLQNLKFFRLFILGKRGQENVLQDILERKNAFLDYRNTKFKKSKNWNFSKGVRDWSKSIGAGGPEQRGGGS